MLSEEEKKAIEILKQFRDYYAREDINKENFNSNENYEKALTAIKILRNSFDTVLNLITRLQKENEDLKSRKNSQEKRFKKYKENIEKQHEEIYENLVSEKEKYVYLYQKALDNTVKSDKENIDLKKQIDLMGEVIFKKFAAQLVLEYGIENKEQFIKLFEEKVKGIGEQ